MKLTRILKHAALKALFPFLRTFKNGEEEYLLDNICRCLESEAFYPSFKLRRKNIIDQPIRYDLCEAGDVAIVLQGPIFQKDDMTLNSIRYYKKMYSGACVILSTWEDEPEDLVEKCKEAGAVIVKSRKPEKSGILNINYQLVNTLEGIKEAKKLGYKYTAKTRTDQRVCKPYSLNSLISMINLFPVNGESKQEKRIVALPTNYGSIFVPYFVSDFFYFGVTDDVLKLFDIELDDRDNKATAEPITRKDFAANEYPPEIYILKHFLRNNTSQKCDDTLSDYWECLSRYFIIIDMDMIDLYVPKYSNSHIEHRLKGTYYPEDNEMKKLTMQFGFCEWLNCLIGNMKYNNELEKETDIPLKNI